MSSAPSLADLESKVQSGEFGNSKMVPIAVIESEFFTFEVIIRPDKVVVLHLRNLKQNFRNRKMMDFLAKYIRDRIGGYKRFFADFTGEISGINGKQEINSIDIFITEYAPVLVHDLNFVQRHLTNLGQKLIEDLRGAL